MALDLLETIRPSIEAWLLNWITREPLRHSDFFETGTGNCRLMSRLCSQLSETAPLWGKLVAPWAEYVAHTLWAGPPQAKSVRGFKTPLTQAHRREAKGGSPQPPTVRLPRPQRLCRGCGKPIRTGRNDCAHCAIQSATKRLADAARIGRVATRSPEARAKHAASRRRHAQACSAWDPSSQPAWLTPELYAEKIQPLLAAIPTSTIACQLGVSRWYAGRIRQGYRPHPRHWQALAQLARISRRE